MIDSDGWKPLVFLIIIAGILGIKYLVLPGSGWNGLLVLSAIVLWVLVGVISAIRDGQRKDGWVRPTARVDEMDPYCVYIEGNTEEIFRMGIPRAGTQTHLGYKKWRVDINSQIVTPRDVADFINQWDGSSE